MTATYSFSDLTSRPQFSLFRRYLSANLTTAVRRRVHIDVRMPVVEQHSQRIEGDCDVVRVCDCAGSHDSVKRRGVRPVGYEQVEDHWSYGRGVAKVNVRGEHAGHVGELHCPINLGSFVDERRDPSPRRRLWSRDFVRR